MKKLILILGLLATFSILGFSQVNNDAIGLRLNSGVYNSAEVSYQKRLSNINRIELDFGFGGGISYQHSNYQPNYSDHYYNQRLRGLMFTAVYHWDFNIINGLNWYIGPGANVGILMYKDYRYAVIGSQYDNAYRVGVDIGVGGQIGIEYDFNHLGVPILVSTDFRPMVQLLPFFNGYDYFYNWGGALSVRYTF